MPSAFSDLEAIKNLSKQHVDYAYGSKYGLYGPRYVCMVSLEK